jgi:hypothetical protein
LFHKLIPLFEGNCITKEQESCFNKLGTCELIQNLVKVFTRDYKNIEKEKERLVNNMSLMISILTIYPDLSDKSKGIVKFIIEIAKERTDLLRKNAAILLAKVAKSSDEMQNYVRELHGMDVLLNVAKFINIKK